MQTQYFHNDMIYTLSNENLKVGDYVYPISNGVSNDETHTYKHEYFDFNEVVSSFPNDPHIILDLHHSESKAYEIRTSKGYGPVEKYFKIISQKLSVQKLEEFIRYYVPKGWVGPIHEFTFAPYITEDEFEIILQGKIPDGEKFDKWFVKAAIEDWLKQNGLQPS